MEAVLSLGSSTSIVVPTKHGVGSGCFLKQRMMMTMNRKNSYTYISCCHSSGNVTNHGGFVTENSSSTILTADDHHNSAPPGLFLTQQSNNNNNSTITHHDHQVESLILPFNGTKSTSMEEDDDDGIGITNFLGGKTLFITGATGFLGKVLIEKILRTIPDIHKIYIMVKAKNIKAAMERLENDIINAELFECLKKTYGNSYRSFMLSKIVPVLGNVTESSLGLDEDIANMMVKEVDIIVNSAANTTFDERYDVALDINTGGPSRLINFARKCHKIKLFVQISTAYANGKRQGIIMEKPFYVGESIAAEAVFHGGEEPPPPTFFKVEDELKLVLESKQDLDEHVVSQKIKELGLERANKYGWQDTYVFTKAMGEMMIENLRGDIPVVVIRPSVIESTYKEPFPGWMEGSRMMDPIILYYGKGLLTGFLVDSNGVLDVVPADMVVNATIAAIGKHGREGGGAEKPESNIYQIASSAVNPLVFEDLASMLYEYFSSSPCLDSKGNPIHVQRMKLFSSMGDLSSHLWDRSRRPESMMAYTTINNDKKLESICRKSMEQVKYLARLYEPYTFYGGRFDNSNSRTLMESMSIQEKQEFGFDIESIDWKNYIKNIHIPGLRRHVMKGRIGRN